MNNIYDGLLEILDEKDIRKDEIMRCHTSFKIGGTADFVVTPRTEKDIKKIVVFAKEMNIPLFIMGNGSNLLVRDKGIRGIVMKISDNFSEFSIEGNLVTAQSGILMSTISKHILKASLKGFEFGSGIPGTIGGAVTMNAGAYDGEIKDVITSVRVMDLDGNIFDFTNEEMNFGYRKSLVTEKKLIVISVTMNLPKGNYSEIKAKIDDFTERRTTKQPLKALSAGSTFKRPEGNFAGKLIQEAGLKGIIMKEAAVSDLHSGFVINLGKASCENILELIEFIKATVYSKFQVMLEEEVKIVGEE
ncbi:UDP-N-acetylmuramate dehydrogenase [Acetoanaerobium pronyense]|uniref:UDP-N-acetylenolpyruvoylglucosamine reductase n=1 Tax=Acetoanaerobium pronyense TaxID=1482736 RepID=A0ABS4KGF0_9FIRM|nr:UDP-N-acetylmuramate dehydrogenase [Acetoanaerobium pronyense]MBP2026827.1 UDP-N-acetylmuramate dehydrogenase [Acetoanaerobium pronyense]